MACGKGARLQDACVARPPRPVAHVRRRRLAHALGVLGPRTDILGDLLPRPEPGVDGGDVREGLHVVAVGIAVHEVWRQLALPASAHGLCGTGRPRGACGGRRGWLGRSGASAWTEAAWARARAAASLRPSTDSSGRRRCLCAGRGRGAPAASAGCAAGWRAGACASARRRRRRRTESRHRWLHLEQVLDAAWRPLQREAEAEAGEEQPATGAPAAPAQPASAL